MTVREIRSNLNGLVLHRRSGARYQLAGATIRKDQKTGAVWYQAELRDLAAPYSVRICKLEDIEILKE